QLQKTEMRTRAQGHNENDCSEHPFCLAFTLYEPWIADLRAAADWDSPRSGLSVSWFEYVPKRNGGCFMNAPTPRNRHGLWFRAIVSTLSVIFALSARAADEAPLRAGMI